MLEFLFNNVAGLNYIKKRLQHSYFPSKFTNFLRVSANDCFWIKKDQFTIWRENETAKKSILPNGNLQCHFETIKSKVFRTHREKNNKNLLDVFIIYYNLCITNYSQILCSHVEFHLIEFW